MKPVGAASLSRRALLAAPALSPVSFAAEPLARLPRRIRLALIGADGHTSEIFGPLDRLPDVELVAVADRNPSGLAALSKRKEARNARSYSDYRLLLDKEQPDIAAVCNTNGDRAAAVIECAWRGIGVIAEKPLAIGWDELKRVRETVESKKVPLGMLLPMRYDPPYRALKEIVDSGEIGEVAMIDAQKSYKAGMRPAWFQTRAAYGSTMAWIGIHMVDLMRFVSGRELTEVAAFHARLGFPELGEMETITAAAFRLDNGGAATLRMEYFRPETAPTHGDDRLRLAGPKGVVEYAAATGVTVMSRQRKPERLSTLPPAGSVFVEYLEFAIAGKPTSLPHREIYRLNEIVLHARDAADEGRLVRIPGSGTGG